MEWLRRISDQIGQQARWLELLDEYEYEIIHREGGHRAHHENADALSRTL